MCCVLYVCAPCGGLGRKVVYDVVNVVLVVVCVVICCCCDDVVHGKILVMLVGRVGRLPL